MMHLPQATVLFSADTQWILKRRKEIAEFAGEKYLCVCASEPLGAPIPGVTYLEKRFDAGLSTDPTGLHVRGTSGYAALNLAFLKGAKRILLLGYDFNQDNGQAHWYPDGARATAVGTEALQDWAEEFTLAEKQLQRSGVLVLNYSPGSRIRCFQKVPIKPLLGEKRKGA
jgi:hypothetical protein